MGAGQRVEQKGQFRSTIPYPPNALTGETQAAILVRKIKKVEVHRTGRSARPGMRASGGGQLALFPWAPAVWNLWFSVRGMVISSNGRDSSDSALRGVRNHRAAQPAGLPRCEDKKGDPGVPLWMSKNEAHPLQFPLHFLIEALCYFG